MRLRFRFVVLVGDRYAANRQFVSGFSFSKGRFVFQVDRIYVGLLETLGDDLVSLFRMYVQLGFRRLVVGIGFFVTLALMLP